MPTRKIKDLPKRDRCPSPEHNPPTNYVYEDGVWEHICPRCGKKTKFTVEKPTL